MYIYIYILYIIVFRKLRWNRTVLDGYWGNHSVPCSWLWIRARHQIWWRSWLLHFDSWSFICSQYFTIKFWPWFNPWWKLIGDIVITWAPKPRITWKAEERATRDAKRDRNKSQLNSNHEPFQHSQQKPVENSSDLFMFVPNFSDFS